MFEQADVLLTYVRARLNLRNEEGQALVEYALILALIALVAVGGLEFVAGPAPGFFSKVGSLIGQ